jgi:hypothetical protein
METKSYFLSNPDELTRILHQDSELAQAIAGDDDLLLKEIIRTRQ